MFLSIETAEVPMWNDHVMLKRLRDGDQHAVRLIYERYREPLLAVSVTICPDAHVAEDIFHDVFMSFLMNAPRLQLRSSLYHYLYTGIRNGVRDILRRRKRSQQREPVPSPPELQETPAMLADLSESEERLQRYLTYLPMEQRQVLFWRAYSGLQFEEIARRQGTCSSTARGRYRYGISKLSSLMCSQA